MRVCTITCHNALNYGARLQAYALLRYLAGQGHAVEIIDYRPCYMSFREKIWYWPGGSVKEWAKFFLRFRQRVDNVRRHACFEEFSRKYLARTSKIYADISDLRAAPPPADVYVAGSDQIWNTTFRNGTDAAYYLDFGDDSVKRISYAASFALTSLRPGSEVFVEQHLARFDTISVREESGLEILNSLGYEGQVTVDPVLLLSAKEWDGLIGDTCASERYILVYDIMGCRTLESVAKRLSGFYGCRIYSIGSRRLAYADRNFTRSAPDEFVALVRNSLCVVSNSFHGTVFAMIYHRDFFVIDRADGLNDRMHALLRSVGLGRRAADCETSDEQLREHVSYDSVDSILNDQIAKSRLFLDKALKDKDFS